MIDTARVTQLAPDCWRIRLPLPFRLREVNVFLLRGPDGYTLIDTGLGTPEGRATFDAALKELGIVERDIKDVYVTHLHPDHIGMSGRRAQAGARVHLMAEEEPRARYVWGKQWLSSWADFTRAHGAGNDIAEGVVEAVNRLRAFVSLPDRFEYVKDGEVVSAGARRLRVVWTPGHSDFHYVLVDDDASAIFCGDQLLPIITPNIGLYPECRPNPLEDYLWSLTRFTRESSYTIYPAHGEPYASLPERIAQLQAHHAQRLQGVAERVRAAGGAGTPAFGIVQYFWGNRLTTHEVRFALAEIVAHLEFLRLRDELTREERGGVFHYRHLL
jgi:glyoxylase-like metal-dependent hydrolase (beta-lactamase superfamily II)